MLLLGCRLAAGTLEGCRGVIWNCLCHSFLHGSWSGGENVEKHVVHFCFVLVFRGLLGCHFAGGVIREAGGRFWWCSRPWVLGSLL